MIKSHFVLILLSINDKIQIRLKNRHIHVVFRPFLAPLKSLHHNILPPNTIKGTVLLMVFFCEKCLIISQMIVERKQGPNFFNSSYFSLEMMYYPDFG